MGWTVLFLAAVATSTGCEQEQTSASPAAEAKETNVDSNEVDPIPIETLEIRAEDHVETFSSFGILEPIDSVTVSAETAGRALNVPFKEGEQIRAGQRVLRVDTQLDSARIDVLESQVDSAQREYDRTKELAEQGLATPQQLDQGAESALETAQLNLKQARVAASKGGVRSPVSGYVHRKLTEEGEWVGPGSPIATIIDMDKLKVVGNVPESRLRYVEEGAEVDIVIPARDEVMTGTIHRIGLDALPQTRTYPVEVHISNPEMKLRPGMHARVEFVKKTWKQALKIPRDAILQGFSGSEAMVFPNSEGGVAGAELRRVALGPNDGAEVLVKSGLEDGQRLIVRGHRGLVDGALVREVNHWESLEQFRNPQDRLNLGSPDAAEGSE